MNKQDMIDVLVNQYGELREDLNRMRVTDLKRMYEATIDSDVDLNDAEIERFLDLTN